MMVFDNSSSSKIRVLFVDDDEDILMISKLSLEKDGIMVITTATSAAEAMKIMEIRNFDVVVSDYYMPGINGIDFLKQLRNKNDLTPFAFFTGRGNERLAIEAINSGANGYLEKGGILINRFEDLSKSIQRIFSDNKKEKQLQEQLKINERKYRLLVENSHDAIFTIDQKGIITFVSQSWRSLVGRSPTEAIGRSFEEFIHPDDVEACKKMLNQSKESSVEYRIRHIDGSWRWHHVNATALMDGNNIVVGHEGSVSDVTYFKEMECNLRMLNKKLKLISSITRHDVFNHLTAGMIYLDLVRSDNLSPEQVEDLDKAFLAMQRIKSQIDFAKTYEDIGSENPRWEIVSDLILRTENENIILKNNCYGLLVYADPMLAKCFHNLMDNTLRHSIRATEVCVRYEIKDNGVVIIWEDNGIGVQNDKKEKIFERGFGENTGMGLFLTKEILAITGIMIHETGIPEKGARFEIFVPKKNYIIKGSD
ncbi:MAG: response regulator [Candidatus Paceibacterota bacterium]|jgi:PAS domain S-box-containing protein